eukprot:4852892-Amphidinium_carterae.1
MSRRSCQKRRSSQLALAWVLWNASSSKKLLVTHGCHNWCDSRPRQCRGAMIIHCECPLGPGLFPRAHLPVGLQGDCSTRKAW